MSFDEPKAPETLVPKKKKAKVQLPPNRRQKRWMLRNKVNVAEKALKASQAMSTNHQELLRFVGALANILGIDPPKEINMLAPCMNEIHRLVSDMKRTLMELEPEAMDSNAKIEVNIVREESNESKVELPKVSER